MKLHGAFLLLLTSTTFASTYLAKDGSLYSYDEWSQPEMITIQSDSGNAQVEKRTLRVTCPPPRGESPLTIVLLSSPAYDKALLTVSCDTYVAMGGYLCGIRKYGGDLQFRRSHLPTTGNLMASASESLTFLLEKPYGIAENEDVVSVPVIHRFGRISFLKPGESRGLSGSFSIQGVEFNGANLAIRLQTIVKRSLEVLVDSKFSIVSSSENGVTTKPLRTGNYKTTDVRWGRQIEVPILTPSGSSTIPACRLFLDPGEFEGITKVTGVTAARDLVGKYWIGPVKCQLAYFAGGIVGVAVNEDGSVSAYFNNTILPTDSTGAVAFEPKFAEFSTALPTFGYSTSTTVDLANLFPAQKLSGSSEVRLISLRVTDGLEIRLGTNEPSVEMMVVLGPSLAPIAHSIVKAI